MAEEYDDANYDIDYNDNATCESEGMFGRCGEECRVFLRYDCPIHEEVIDGLIEQYKNDFSKCDEDVVEMIEEYQKEEKVIKQNDDITKFDEVMEMFN